MKNTNPPELVRSYILVNSLYGNTCYVSYGTPPVLTPDLKNARRYAREASANSAIHRLRKRALLLPETLKVEAIDE